MMPWAASAARRSVRTVLRIMPRRPLMVTGVNSAVGEAQAVA